MSVSLAGVMAHDEDRAGATLAPPIVPGGVRADPRQGLEEVVLLGTNIDFRLRGQNGGRW